MIFNVGAGGASTAEAVQYDNSISGLEATNVQGALDEVTDSLPKLFVDTTNIIYESSSLDATWVATENAYVSISIKATDGTNSPGARIDGVNLFAPGSTTAYARGGFYIKKGQTLSINKGGGGSAYTTAYGLI